MKSGVLRDKRVRASVATHEVRRLALKYAQRSDLLSPFDVTTRFAQLPRSSSKVRVKRFCIRTGRSHGVLRKFRRSRRRFKEFASRGKLEGVRPASW